MNRSTTFSTLSDVAAARGSVDRFMSKVEPVPEAGCWLWTGSTRGDWHGQFRLLGSMPAAHRVSWAIHKGTIPAGMLVCHKCDTPRCVNPDHLFLGTDEDNNHDMQAKGRKAMGQRVGIAKLSNEKAASIFSATGSRAEIAAEHGVTRLVVGKIKRGEIYASVSGAKNGQ